MGFSKNSFCRIFSVEDKGKYSVARVAISKKGQDGNYETTWSDNFTRLVGTAHEQLKGATIPQKGISAKIGNCDVTNKYDKEKKITYTNYVIFGFDEVDGQANGAKTQTKVDDSFMNVDDSDMDMLPFN